MPPPSQPRPRRHAWIALVEARRCTGCGRCVAACGPRLLSLEVVRWRKRAVLHDAPDCTGCRLCERRCPFGAITVRAADTPQSLANADVVLETPSG